MTDQVDTSVSLMGKGLALESSVICSLRAKLIFPVEERHSDTSKLTKVSHLKQLRR